MPCAIGLLTRMLGYIGIASGAMMVLFPLPIVQIFWFGALGFVLLGALAGRRAARVGDGRGGAVADARAAAAAPAPRSSGARRRVGTGALERSRARPAQAQEAQLTRNLAASMILAWYAFG